MNLFLPYSDNVSASVVALDDKRLLKQILECKQMLDIYNGLSKGYSHHPVVEYYRQHKDFVAFYGHLCCMEYISRFNKLHKFNDYFYQFEWNYKCVPFYAEYPKTDERSIRTTENVSELFQNKLINKWKNDKIKPKWTKRNIPYFYYKSMV